MQGADIADQLQAFAFIALRQAERDAQPTPDRGVYVYRDPTETWAMAEDTDVDMAEVGPVATPDPLSETYS